LAGCSGILAEDLRAVERSHSEAEPEGATPREALEAERELFERITCLATLESSWQRLRRKRPTPGSDGMTREMFDARSRHYLLQLEADLREQCYRPQLLCSWMRRAPGHRDRRVFIPCIRDRIAQQAVIGLLAPPIEAQASPVAHAYLPGRSCRTALRAVEGILAREVRWVALADIDSFFESIDHGRLGEILRSRFKTEAMPALLLAWVHADIWDGQTRSRLERGLPTGLPISPLLSHLYLEKVDRALASYPAVRYADDLAIFASGQEEAIARLEELRIRLRPLGLRLNESKSGVRSLAEGFGFLGVEFQAASPAALSVHSRVHGRPHSGSNGAQTGRPSPGPRVLYVRETGAVLRRVGRKFVVSKDRQDLMSVAAHKVSQIVILGQVRVTTPALYHACDNAIPVYFVTASGRYKGAVESPSAANLDLERFQWARSFDQVFSLRTAKQIVARKITSQITFLSSISSPSDPAPWEWEEPLRATRDKAERVLSLPELLGCEGQAAAVYFHQLAGHLPAEFAFPGRKTHPSLDPINALLSFGYGLVAQNVYTLIRLVGLNPRVGFLHRSQGDFPALAYDLMEEFRAPVVDALVVDLLRRKAVNDSDFDRTPTGCWLRKEKRRCFLQEFEAWLQQPNLVLGNDARGWRFVMEKRVRRFADYLAGKAPRFD
jgi:CRISPR-associated protein Cas1